MFLGSTLAKGWGAKTEAFEKRRRLENGRCDEYGKGGRTSIGFGDVKWTGKREKRERMGVVCMRETKGRDLACHCSPVTRNKAVIVSSSMDGHLEGETQRSGSD